MTRLHRYIAACDAREAISAHLRAACVEGAAPPVIAALAEAQQEAYVTAGKLFPPSATSAQDLADARAELRSQR